MPEFGSLPIGPETDGPDGGGVTVVDEFADILRRKAAREIVSLVKNERETLRSRVMEVIRMIKSTAKNDEAGRISDMISLDLIRRDKALRRQTETEVTRIQGWLDDRMMSLRSWWDRSDRNPARRVRTTDEEVWSENPPDGGRSSGDWYRS